MRIIKTAFALLIVFFWGAGSDAMPSGWQVYETDNFKVFYKNSDKKFVRKVYHAAKAHSRSIAKKLGVDISHYWKSDTKVNIYIYDDKPQYLSNTGQPEWSDGSSIQRLRTIYSFAQARGFFDDVLPHELGHIILKEISGFENDAVPVWLEEGVAALQEKTSSKGLKALMRDALKKGELLAIEEMDEIDIRKVTDKRLLDLFYGQSLSIVKYMTEGLGLERFSDFCAALRQTQDLKQALGKAYSFNDIFELERSWKAYLLD